MKFLRIFMTQRSRKRPDAVATEPVEAKLIFNTLASSALALIVGLAIGSSAALAQEVDPPSIVKGELKPIPTLQTARTERLITPSNVSQDVLTEDFESGAPGWTMAGDWEIGAVTSGPNSGGFGNSTQAAATILAGNHSNGADYSLTSPPIMLPSGAYDYGLEYAEWFQIENCCDDGITELSVDDGATWTLLTTVTGDSNGWSTRELPLQVADGAMIRIRFRFTSDGSVTNPGWYIDDLRVIVTELEPIELDLVTLDAQDFPIVRAQMRVDDLVGNCPDPLTDVNVEVYEDDVLQTDLFEVTPPGDVSLADIVFLMDNSGSMGDEQAAVIANIEDFVDDLGTGGVNANLGLTRYGQSSGSGDPILEDNGSMTTDALYFKDDVLVRNETNGSREPGYRAIYDSAAGYSFRPGSQRIFIEITDEYPNQGSGPGYELQDAVDALDAADATLFALTGTDLFPYFEPLVDEPTVQILDILSPFDQILDHIVDRVASIYSLRYQTTNPAQDGQRREVRIEVNCGNDTGTVIGHYTPNAAPQITRTVDTIALSGVNQTADQELSIVAEVSDAEEPLVEAVSLYYRGVNETSFTQMAMTRTAGDEAAGTWSANIPAAVVQGPGVAYYLTATDTTLTTSRPSVNPSADPYLIPVDNDPPILEHTPVSTAPIATPIQISATASDTSDSLDSVTLYYREVGDVLYQQVAMTDQGAGAYQAEIPAASMTLNGVEYYLVAYDNYGLSATSGTVEQPWLIEAVSSLTVTLTGNGTGVVTSTPAGIDCGADCNENYDSSLDVTLTAQPSANAEFGGWGGACSGTDLSCTLAMDENKTVEAEFVVGYHPINVTVNPEVGGSVNCVDNPVPNGQDSLCTATPNVGYSFTDWAEHCAHSGTDPSCTLSAVTSEKNVTANFALNQYPITALADPAVGGTVSCTPNLVDHGQDSLCQATANEDYVFTGWSGAYSGTLSSCTIRGVDSPQTVTAEFAPEPEFPVNITVQPPAGGTVTCDPNPVPSGDDSLCTATANSDYVFDSWGGDCSGTIGTQCTLSSVASDQSVTATFIAIGASATHWSEGYIPGALHTVHGRFNETSEDTLVELIWTVELPEGWEIVEVNGDGQPQVEDNVIVFARGSLPKPIEFSYRVRVPGPDDAEGEQMIYAAAEYRTEAMAALRRILVLDDPLYINELETKPHTADYKHPSSNPQPGPDWKIDAQEYSRVLSFWRNGSYSVDPETVDGYIEGEAGSPLGELHDADYAEPYWTIETGEAQRILAYWRAGAYHVQVDPPTEDGYAPGEQQMLPSVFSARDLVAPAEGDEAPQATQTVSSISYSAGDTLTVTATVGESGDDPLLSLVWMPKLPAGWSIGSIDADRGGPELGLDGKILFTEDELTLPLTFSYEVQVPMTASGTQILYAGFDYWLQGMNDPAVASVEPLVVDDGGATPGGCELQAHTLDMPVTSGTEDWRSEVSLHVAGTVSVAPGAELRLTAPRVTFGQGFRVMPGGQLRATAAPVTCSGN